VRLNLVLSTTTKVGGQAGPAPAGGAVGRGGAGVAHNFKFEISNFKSFRICARQVADFIDAIDAEVDGKLSFASGILSPIASTMRWQIGMAGS